MIYLEIVSKIVLYFDEKYKAFLRYCCNKLSAIRICHKHMRSLGFVGFCGYIYRPISPIWIDEYIGERICGMWRGYTNICARKIFYILGIRTPYSYLGTQLLYMSIVYRWIPAVHYYKVIKLIAAIRILLKVHSLTFCLQVINTLTIDHILVKYIVPPRHLSLS